MSEADGPYVRRHDTSSSVPTGFSPINAKFQGWQGWAAAQAGCVWEDQSISDISLSFMFPAWLEISFAHLLHTVKATLCSDSREAMAATLF